jgi:hypothetical protein
MEVLSACGPRVADPYSTALTGWVLVVDMNGVLCEV